MKVLESAAARNLTRTFMDGFRLNWLGVAGDSVSRWLTGRELMSVQTELDLNAGYLPLTSRSRDSPGSASCSAATGRSCPGASRATRR